jgi:hypothetical protein
MLTLARPNLFRRPAAPPRCPRCRRPVRSPYRPRVAPGRRALPWYRQTLAMADPAYNASTGLPLYGLGGLPMCGCQCDGGCCYDNPGGITSATVTFTAGTACACHLSAGLAGRLSGALSGTFTLFRTSYTHPDLGTATCAFGRDETPYTGAVYQIHQDASLLPGGDRSGTTDCDDPVICASDRLRIRLFFDTSVIPARWKLWAELSKVDPSTCECDTIPSSNPPAAYQFSLFEGAYVFYAEGFTLNMCGGTATVAGSGTCFGGEIVCGAAGNGFFNPYPDVTVATGGSATITL